MSVRWVPLVLALCLVAAAAASTAGAFDPAIIDELDALGHFSNASSSPFNSSSNSVKTVQVHITKIVMYQAGGLVTAVGSMPAMPPNSRQTFDITGLPCERRYCGHEDSLAVSTATKSSRQPAADAEGTSSPLSFVSVAWASSSPQPPPPPPPPMPVNHSLEFRIAQATSLLSVQQKLQQRLESDMMSYRTSELNTTYLRVLQEAFEVTREVTAASVNTAEDIRVLVEERARQAQAWQDRHVAASAFANPNPPFQFRRAPQLTYVTGSRPILERSVYVVLTMFVGELMSWDPNYELRVSTVAAVAVSDPSSSEAAATAAAGGALAAFATVRYAGLLPTWAAKDTGGAAAAKTSATKVQLSLCTGRPLTNVELPAVAPIVLKRPAPASPSGGHHSKRRGGAGRGFADDLDGNSAKESVVYGATVSSFSRSETLTASVSPPPSEEFAIGGGGMEGGPRRAEYGSIAHDDAVSTASVVQEGSRLCFDLPEAHYDLETGQQAEMRVPLARIGHVNVTLQRQAAPSASPTVVQVAVLVNGATAASPAGDASSPPAVVAVAPLLPGPILIFVDGAYRMRRFLPYTAAGANASMIYGIDDWLTVSRRGKSREKQEGFQFIGTQRKVARYSFESVVRNSGPVAAVVEITEALPVTDVEGVDISVIAMGCDQPGVLRCVRDRLRDGFITLHVLVVPFAERSVDLAYDVSWPADMSLVGLPPIG